MSVNSTEFFSASSRPSKEFRGRAIAVVPADESGDKYLASVTLAQLKSMGLRDPATIDFPNIKDMVDLDRKAKDASIMRSTIQRRFDGKRKKRAVFYKEYLSQMYAEGSQTMRDAPPINLFIPAEYAAKFRADTSELYLNDQGFILVIDGETQTHARFLLSEDDFETENYFFPVVIHNGITPEAAMQRLHDYNRYATPIKEGETSALNLTGALTIAANKAIENSDFRNEDVDRFNSAPIKKRPLDKCLIAYMQILAAVLGISRGHSSIGTALSTLITEANEHGAVGNFDTKEVNVFVNALYDTGLQPYRNIRPEVFQVAGVLYAENLGRNVSELLKHCIDTFADVAANSPKGMRNNKRAETVYRALKQIGVK